MREFNNKKKNDNYWNMAKLSKIFSKFDDIIEHRSYEISFDEHTAELEELYNTLEFFFNKGNDGCNALRELLEEFTEDTVDFEFESNEKEYLITLSACYQYHDFDIQCVKQFDNGLPNVYKIVDTSRKCINQIKTEFNLKKIW